LLDEPSEAIGVRSRTRPVITELPIEPDLHVAVFTDGVLSAGVRHGASLDASSFFHEKLQSCPAANCSRYLADALLARAVELDRGRPQDDVTVAVISVVERQQSDDVRRLSVRFPL
jgi:serine phosphatase RsbU (regulator of sigma subunit)